MTEMETTKTKALPEQNTLQHVGKPPQPVTDRRRRAVNPRTSDGRSWRRLQRDAGNQAVASLFHDQEPPTTVGLGVRPTSSATIMGYGLPDVSAEPSAAIAPQELEESAVTDTTRQSATDLELPAEASASMLTPAPSTERPSVVAPVARAPGQSQSLERAELASAAAQPDVAARQVPGGPIILQPRQEPPPPPPLPALRPETSPTPPRPELAPESPSPASESAEVVQQEMPSATAAATMAEQPATPPLADITAVEAEPAAPPSETPAPETEENVQTEAEQAGGKGEAPPAGPIRGAGAGAAIVSPPAPEMLRAQIPEQEPTLEEFQTLFESGRTETDDRTEAQQLLNSLRATAEQEKAAVLVQAEAQKAQIASEAESQIAVVQAALAAQMAAVQAHYAAAREAMVSYAEQQKASLVTQVEQDVARVEQETAALIATVQEQFTQRQTDLTTYAETEQARPPSIAQQEADRADRELEAAAREAEQVGEREARNHPGNEDPNPEKRRAAREVARESAADIRAKKPAIAEDLRSRAADFSGRYLEYAQTVNTQITQARETLIPGLRDAAARTIAALRQGQAAAVQAVDARLGAEMPALTAGEAQAIAQLQMAGATATSQIQAGAQRAAGEVDAATAALVTEIDSTVADTEGVITKEEAPFLPGVVEVVEAARASIMQTAVTGRQNLGESGVAARNMLAEVARSFASQSAQLASDAQESASQVQTRAQTAIDQALSSRSEQAQSQIAGLTTQQQGMIDEVLAQIDSAITQARAEIRGINDRFRTDLRQAANESILEAKKPLTDPLPDRASAAAAKVDDAWYVGLFRALGDILVGLVILVVVALVVAAIAAAFGVILTAWTAVMIAGAILLAVGFVVAIVNRAGQQELGGNPLAIVGLALLDTVGITGIYEGIAGEDIVTGQALGAADRTQRGVTGAFTLVMLVLGARAAIKGPPGGVYTRPTGLPRGWVGWRGALPAAWRGVRGVATELYTGLRQGVRNLREWLRERLGREGPRAPEEAGPGPRPRQEPGESPQDYRQRLREWFERQRGQRQYEELLDERIANAENRIQDPRNQRWWDEATPRERRLAYDFDHEGQILDQGINEARLGLLAERQGVVDGPIRRSQVGGEFVDSNNVVWDVKSGRSGPETIADDLISGRNILLDREGALSETQFRNLLQRLAAELQSRGRGDIVPDLGQRVQPVPPYANVPPPVIPDRDRDAGSADQ